jgi:hypothetical protein
MVYGRGVLSYGESFTERCGGLQSFRQGPVEVTLIWRHE